MTRVLTDLEIAGIIPSTGIAWNPGYARAIEAAVIRKLAAGEPVYAYGYQLASRLVNGEYTGWSKPLLGFDRPNVPDGSMRNLKPLYTTPPPTIDAQGLQPVGQAAETETNDATFGAILFAFVRMSLVYPTEAQLHQLDRLISFYGDQKFASQLKLLAHQARTPHVNRDVGRARPLVFSGSEGIGREESGIQAVPTNHKDLKQLAEAALERHDGTGEGFSNWRAANRAFRRQTHPAAILSLLSELNACKHALKQHTDPKVVTDAPDLPGPVGVVLGFEDDSGMAMVDHASEGGPTLEEKQCVYSGDQMEQRWFQGFLAGKSHSAAKAQPTPPVGQAAVPTTFPKERSQLKQEWSNLRQLQEQYKAALARQAAGEPVKFTEETKVGPEFLDGPVKQVGTKDSILGVHVQGDTVVIHMRGGKHMGNQWARELCHRILSDREQAHEPGGNPNAFNKWS